MDSRQFVVFSDRPTPRTARGDAASGSRPALPPDCRRRIGSGPPARDGASRAHPAPRCTSGGCRRWRHEACSRLARYLTTFSRLCHWHRWTRARSRKAFRTADRSPLPPSRITSTPWETSRPRSTTTAGMALAPARSLCPFRRSPGSVSPRHRHAQRDDHRRLGERLAVQDHGHHVLTG